MPLATHILVVIDPTETAQPALEHAAALARRTGARLELFICAYDASLLDASHADLATLARARTELIGNRLNRLRSLAKPLQDQGLTVTVDARWDSPLHEGILRKAAESSAGLVVKDTHYHPLLKRSFFSNTDWHLIRECPTPLWLCKPRALPEKPRILAAVDPLHEMDKAAELDHAIMTAATDLAAATGGETHVFHAFDIAATFAYAAPLSSPIVLPLKELVDAATEQHTTATHELTDRYRVPHERVHIHQGAARDGLVAATEHLAADVVVMGALSRRGLSRLFIGNTAEDVLDKIGCDILVVKTAALAAELQRAA